MITTCLFSFGLWVKPGRVRSAMGSELAKALEADGLVV